MNMLEPWTAKWKVERDLKGGAQGKPSVVTSLGDTGLSGVLKVLKDIKSKTDRLRLQSEVANLKRLSEAGLKVPRVLDDGNVYDLPGGDAAIPPYFVMEYIEGRPLHSAVSQSKRLSLDLAAALILDLCATVAAAHNLGVVHRDLKPDNIIVRNLERPDLVLIDFGISFSEGADSETVTGVGEALGNKFLRLPELLSKGGNKRDARSDVTLLSGLLYYCLTRHAPDVLRDGSGQPPHRRKGLSARDVIGDDHRCGQLELLLDVGFRENVNDRFQSCEAFASRLQEVLSGVVKRSADPAAALASITARQRKHDRQTQLNEIKGYGTRLIDRIKNHAEKAFGTSHLNLDLQFGAATALPNAQTLPEGSVPLTETGIITLTLKPHNYCCRIHYLVGARNGQGALLRFFRFYRTGSEEVPLQETVWESLGSFAAGPMSAFDVNDLIRPFVDRLNEDLVTAVDGAAEYSGLPPE